MGFTIAASFWLLFTGVLLFGERGRQSAYAEPMPVNPDLTAIPDVLEDPVQVGRGGRAPAVLTSDAAPVECLGARVTFAYKLDS